MNIPELLNDKTVKQKEKTEILGKGLLDNTITVNDLITFAGTAKDTEKATCIEALEFATKQNAKLANKKCFQFVTQTLTAKSPRVKWESAKVIGNIAHLFKDNLDDAVHNLLENAASEGTVVRWSAALALGEIIKLKTKRNTDLLPVIEGICSKEQQNSVVKIYQAAIKKA